MSILKVARLGHPVLRTKARALTPSEIRRPELQQLIDDMIETMQEYQGIGLAAPQIHESVRLFVAGIEGEDEQIDVLPFINPVITPLGRNLVEDWEGCLSIPDIRGRVPRPKDVSVRAFDRHGESFEVTLRGYPARVVQHEADHLDGVLFVDRMTSFETLTFLEEYGRYWAEAR
ncbi:MAG: peptide deformylase [Vicinamibacterales bacterium]